MMLNKRISKILRKKGTLSCIQKAEILENNSAKIRDLNLRNLDLEANDVLDIMDNITQESDAIPIKSISFSYNLHIGDVGAILIAKKLPGSMSELGLVGCGITDKGGTEILNWMRTSQNLQMICIENNKFSDQLKKEFSIFKKENPEKIVVF